MNNYNKKVNNRLRFDITNNTRFVISAVCANEINMLLEHVDNLEDRNILTRLLRSLYREIDGNL